MQSDRYRGFTLIEVLVVLSVISILAAILLPVFAQTREQARQVTCMGNTRQLLSAALLYTQDYDEKLPVLGTGIDGRGRWMWQIKDYVKNARVYTCPHVPANQYDGTMWTEFSGYGWAEHLWGKKGGPTDSADGYDLAEIGHPAETIVLGDTGFDRISGWAMYRRPPWTSETGGMPGFYAQFRHHATKVRDFQDGDGQGHMLAMDGLCSFAFLDGHAKGLHADAAFRISNMRDGIALSGDDRYVYWNRY